MDAFRVWAEIDLDDLAHNLSLIRGRLAPGVAVMLVVKADAYGHGAVAVAHHALKCGVEGLGVGTSAEALELRAAGVLAPILVLGTIVDEEAVACLRNGVHIALHSLDRARMLQSLARSLGTIAQVHLKVDTGMGRLGVLPERALDLIEDVHAASHLNLAGVMTHVAAPDGGRDASAIEQLATFDAVLRRARERGLPLGWVHAANSACIFTDMGVGYDAVRPGISAYGVLPEGLAESAPLRPVLSLHSQVVFLKDVPQGAPIGYGGTWSAPRDTRIATVPVGYNDGLSWRLSNVGEVLVRGLRAPVVGRVSMDYTTIDVGHIPGVEVGDRVTMIGAQGTDSIGLEELATRAGSLTNEISCSVGKRVQRLYKGSETLPLPTTGLANPSKDAAPTPATRSDVTRV